MDGTALSDIAAWCGGSLLQGRPSATVTRVSTDTRGMEGGEMFVALTGENFDGHDFAGEAAEKGAAALVVSKLTKETETAGCGVIHVKETVRALQELARRYRQALGLKVVGVTGSNGKTTTKDLLAAVAGQRFAVNATEGNLNNHIGLPLTILRTTAEDEVGVWELGMNHPGEIEELAEIAAPEIGVITNIGVAHLEFMKTTEAIAEEKGMLAEALPAEGCAILSAEDAWTESIAARTAARVVTSGVERGDVQASGLVMGEEGCEFDVTAGGEKVRAAIGVPGRHMVTNALLAVAAGLELGVSLEEAAAGLRAAEVTGGRLQRREIGGVRFIDDSYNANPDSMRAALRTLAEVEAAGRRVAVLGRMAELGEHSEREHRRLGEEARACGVDVVVAVGEEARATAEGASGEAGEVEWFGEAGEAAAYLKESLREGDVVLVKGSRTARMERVIEAYSD